MRGLIRLGLWLVVVVFWLCIIWLLCWRVLVVRLRLLCCVWFICVCEVVVDDLVVVGFGSVVGGLVGLGGVM